MYYIFASLSMLFMLFVLCILFYTLWSMHHVLCISFNESLPHISRHSSLILNSVDFIIYLFLCISLYLYPYIHLIYASYFMQPIICISSEHHFVCTLFYAPWCVHLNLRLSVYASLSIHILICINFASLHFNRLVTDGRPECQTARLPAYLMQKSLPSELHSQLQFLHCHSGNVL